MQSIVHSLEETVAEVHVADGVDISEMHGARHLTVVMSPVVLNTLHVPLVDNNNDLLLGALIDSLEQIVVSHVDEHSLPSGEEDIKVLHVPVDHVRVEALLSELGRLSIVHAVGNLAALTAPETHALVSSSLPEVAEHVLVLLVEKSLPRRLVHFGTEEAQLGAGLNCLFAGELHLETGSQEVKVGRDLVMELEEECVEVPASPEDGASRRVPDVERLHGCVFAEVLIILVELLLRVNVLEKLRRVPPFLIGHDHDGLGLHFLDELLRALSEHRRGV